MHCIKNDRVVPTHVMFELPNLKLLATKFLHKIHSDGINIFAIIQFKFLRTYIEFQGTRIYIETITKHIDYKHASTKKQGEYLCKLEEEKGHTTVILKLPMKENFPTRNCKINLCIMNLYKKQ